MFLYYESVNVVCPFYFSEGKAHIVCEGTVSAYESFIFKDVQKKRKYANTFCKKSYTECERYKKIAMKYK